MRLSVASLAVAVLHMLLVSFSRTKIASDRLLLTRKFSFLYDISQLLL